MNFRVKHIVALSGAFAAGAALTWIAVGRAAARTGARSPLRPAAPDERKTYESHSAGQASYYISDSGEGPPLVLLHGINAAASAYEAKPLLDAFRGERPVYVPDLPGFGFSDRGSRAYSPELYGSFIAEFLDTVAARHGAADVVALSLSCEFAARAALKTPSSVRSLTLISPTGFSARRNQNATERARASNRSDLRYRLLSSPLLAQPLFDAISSRASIRYFLGKSFVGPIDEGLADYSYETAHQDNAKNAPLHFLSGRLFDPNVRSETYESLRMPVQVLYDTDAYVRFDELEGTARRCPNWTTKRIAPTRGLPHFEQPQQTVAALREFFQSLAAPKGLEHGARTAVN